MEVLVAVWQFVIGFLLPVCAGELSVKADEGIEDGQIRGEHPEAK